ncbi:MAG: PepSY-like domain-containing protein [Saprospiraceae bacterium]|nr:PepSY-like domain-containing protein [Saprospiraceae bacterium]
MLTGRLKSADIPKAILNSFMTNFPNVSDVEWEKESNTEYEVEFEKMNKEYTAIFSIDGQLLETENEISKKELTHSCKPSHQSIICQ